ncbi:MAG: glycine/D-amino acid oxidase-like deaminating enzyme [Arenicella sp.]|jgi:glycine/D-amino acid oxidase-like deaminating enzyme
MQRRTLIKLISAATLAGCGQHLPKTKRETRKLRVVVAGAGIIGASIAYQLAKAGAKVTVIDKLGPATHASRGTFAWINATWAKQPQYYHSLNQEGVANWRSLQSELKLPLRWGGSLEWFDGAERQQKLVAQIAEQVAWGEPARMLSAADFAKLEPNVNFAADSYAAYSPNDGTVDPVLATQELLRAAQELGAEIHYPCELLGVSMSGDRLVSVATSKQEITADRLVLATGAAAGSPETIAGINIPQRTTPGVIAITKPMPRLLNRIVATQDVHMHQRNDGRFVLGESTSVWQNDAHAVRLQGRPNIFPIPELAQQHGSRMLAKAAKVLPSLADAVTEDAFIGWRPLPVDGHPVLGASLAKPDIYMAIMHSGVSLAPIVGQLVAHELIQQTSVPKLDNFRPTRSFETVKRY